MGGALWAIFFTPFVTHLSQKEKPIFTKKKNVVFFYPFCHTQETIPFTSFVRLCDTSVKKCIFLTILSKKKKGHFGQKKALVRILEKKTHCDKNMHFYPF